MLALAEENDPESGQPLASSGFHCAPADHPLAFVSNPPLGIRLPPLPTRQPHVCVSLLQNGVAGMQFESLVH